MNRLADSIADLSGRPLGERALRKRRRILDATRVLLERRGLLELRVADIARHLDMSPATFYQYFAGVEDVVLELAREANEELPALLLMFQGSWRGREGRRRAREIVEFFMDHWDRHGAILRVRNLAADEGDGRFMELRGAAMLPVLCAMNTVMRRHRVQERHAAITPDAAALAMSAILDRLAACHHLVEGGAVSHQALVETSAELLYRTLTGR